MSFFVKKPLPLEVIKATQWFKHGDHSKVMGANPNMLCGCILIGCDGNRPHVHVKNGEVSHVYLGDWIVELSDGSVERKSKEAFKATYITASEYRPDMSYIKYLTDTERCSVFHGVSSNYCKHCGTDDLGCKCINDE
jgi:hypothetical protein